MSQKSSTHVGGESDACVVPAKCLNKDGKPLAEGMEGRRATKKNTAKATAYQTQSWDNASRGLRSVREAARVGSERTFTASIQGKSRMRETCMYGSVRGASGN
jgi:hypothetical protein